LNTTAPGFPGVAEVELLEQAMELRVVRATRANNERMFKPRIEKGF
jgi:hypothetical protein